MTAEHQYQYIPAAPLQCKYLITYVHLFPHSVSPLGVSIPSRFNSLSSQLLIIPMSVLYSTLHSIQCSKSSPESSDNKILHCLCTVALFHEVVNTSATEHIVTHVMAIHSYLGSPRMNLATGMFVIPS